MCRRTSGPSSTAREEDPFRIGDWNSSQKRLTDRMNKMNEALHESHFVIPAQAGIQPIPDSYWIPGCHQDDLCRDSFQPFRR
jgi:hypothetical protein